MADSASQYPASRPLAMCQEARPLMVALASAVTVVIAVTVMARVARTPPSA